MVDILPFKGLRFNRDKTGDMSGILAPPYDIITNSHKKFLEQLSDYNIVRLTLPEEGKNKSKYENASDLLESWIGSGILRFDSEDSFYILEEIYTENETRKSFTGLVGLLRVEEYGEKKVLRHEKTLAKPKEDRLNLLTACRANLEFIYTIYEDKVESISNLLESEKTRDPEVSVDAGYDPIFHFKFWKVTNSNTLSKITSLMKLKTLLIADGHHRYETSRLYKEKMASERYLNQKQYQDYHIFPEDYVLALFVSANQSGISIHPTHRVVKFNKKIDLPAVLKILEEYFVLEKIYADENNINQSLKKCAGQAKRCLCLYFGQGLCYFASLKSDLESIYRNLKIHTGEFHEEFEYLDVNVLHKLVISQLFRDYPVMDIKYLHTAIEVMEAVDLKEEGKDYDAGFILNAPSIETVERLSGKGEIMPQKSTYFYPKPCSGLVIYKL